MKTIKQIYKLLFVLVLISLVNTGFSQERKESFEKTYKVSSTGELSFSCYDTDLKVNTWQKDEVKLMGEIVIEGGDKEDQDQLIEVFKNPKVSQVGNSLRIETNMATNTIIVGPFRKTTLVNGKTIRVEKFDANYTLWIPESISFDLKSKYNNIDIAKLTGKVDFELYDADLTMLSYGKDSKFEMKYSTASIGNGGDAIMEIYDSEIEAREMGNVEINSKYSEYEIAAMNTLDFESYDDEIEIGKINSLTSEARYTEFRIESDMTNCILDFYDSDIKMKNIDKLVFKGKYSSVDAMDVKSVKIPQLYDSNLEFGKVGTFVCNESKYDEIEMTSISETISMPSAYSCTFRTDKVEPGFKSFSGEFKYGTINLPLGPSIEFSLKFETTYGDVDFPKNRLKISDMNFEDSKKYFEGQTKENPPCKIEFTAYDTDIDLD